MVLSEPSMRVVPNQSPMAGGRAKPGGSWLLWQVAAQKPDGGGGPGEIVAAANFRAIDGLQSIITIIVVIKGCLRFDNGDEGQGSDHITDFWPPSPLLGHNSKPNLVWTKIF